MTTTAPSNTPPDPGAAEPLQLLEGALSDLAASISFEELSGCTSHTPILVGGLETRSSTTALGRHLVGTLAGAIDLDLRLSALLLMQGTDARAELAQAVHELIGPSNTFSSDGDIHFRDTRRNAWIAEGVVHALLVISARVDAGCVPGRVHALTKPHHIPSQQGLDAVAIYDSPTVPIVAIGESKASRNGGSAQLGEAADLFIEVDRGRYGVELRTTLASLRRALPEPLALQVSDSLWRENRCYLPAIVHETEFDPIHRRPKLAGLVPPVAQRRLLVIRLGAFHAFFDAVADAMRAAVLEVVV